MKNSRFYKLMLHLFVISLIFITPLSVSKLHNHTIAATSEIAWDSGDVAVEAMEGSDNYDMYTAISDGEGGMIVAWQIYSPRQIYVQKVNGDGTVAWATNGIALSSEAISSDPIDITSDGAGGVIAVWKDGRDWDNTSYNIYAQRVSSNGNVQWTSGGLTICNADGSQGYPVVVEDGSGGAIFVWYDGRTSGSGAGVYAQRVNSSGTSQWTSNGVAISTAASGFPTDIISDESGNVIVTWFDSRNGNNDLFVQKLNSSGVAQWTSNGVAISSAAGSQMWGKIVSDGSNGAILAWSDERNGDQDVYLQRVNSSGTVQWTANGITPVSSTEDQDVFDISADGNGGVIVVWDDYRNASNWESYIQKYNASGTAQWTSNGIVLASQTTNSPTVDTDMNGGAIVGMSNSGQTKALAQHFDTDGNKVWNAAGVEIGSGAEDEWNPIAISDGAGGALFVFKDWRNSYNNDLYAQRVTNLNQIDSLDASLNIEDTSGNSLEEGTTNGLTYNTQTTVILYDADTSMAISEIEMTVTNDANFSGVSGDSNATTGKAVVDGLTSAPGTASTHKMLVPIPSGTNHNALWICPNANTIGDVSLSCTGGYQDGATVVSYNGQDYLRSNSDLTGTGAQSIFDFAQVKDTMDRLQVSQASDHTIEFGTQSGLTSSGDIIVVTFDPSGQAFNLSSITVSDIDLEDDGSDLTLAGSAGTDTWGVSINTTADSITFTAPTSGTAYIAAGSGIVAKIGTIADGGSNQITNPATANQYEITIKNTSGSDIETGETEIPIVDDDTVNITSYIDSFILFDIDTSETDEDCDAAGGASPCDSHSGATDDSGYVVDLGEMSYLSVNASGDSVTHADGNAGNINYIYFDLSTNATGGATATIISANGSLDGSGSNTIPSVTNDGDGVTISAGDGAYGIREVSNSTTSGTFTIAGDYDGGASIFGECTTAATQIFSTTSAPMDTGRLQMQVGASPDSSDGTGTYTDTLTFIVTSTF